MLNFLCLNSYFGVELILLQLDDLTEDIVNLDINLKCKDDSSSIDSFIYLLIMSLDVAFSNYMNNCYCCYET